MDNTSKCAIVLFVMAVLAAAAVVVSLVFTADTHDAKKPNIVWILADDLGYHDVGFRNPEVITPNIDKLAAEGVIFTNNYVQSSCTPSRHSLMTGRYPYKTAMQTSVIVASQARCSNPKYKLLPQYLKELGYSTHALGKWNLGYCKEECLPTNRGFDTFVGLFDSHGDYWNHTTDGVYDWQDNTVVDWTAIDTHSEDLIVDRVEEIFDSHNEEEPLFVYFAPQNPHSPSQSKEEFLELYSADLPEARRNYLGLVSGLDWMVGKIVDGLERNGLMDNTYIIFVSDNGGDAGEGLNYPFRGGKGSLFEGGTKSASFIHSKLLEKSQYVNDGLMHITDWLPTIVKLAGGDVSEEDGLDGFNQAKMVTKGGKSKRKSIVYNIDREIEIAPPRTGEIAVRDERFKLIWGAPGYTDGHGEHMDLMMNIPYYQQYVANRTPKSARRRKRGSPTEWSKEQLALIDKFSHLVHVTDEQMESGSGYMQLFDLQNDPTEMRDLSDDPNYSEPLQKLIKFVQDEYNNNYVPMTAAEQFKHEISYFSPDGYLKSGWCREDYPTA